MENKVYTELARQAKYALDSRSRNLVYEVYGAAKMARSLGAISNEEFFTLNTMLVRDGLNNYRNVKLR